MMDEQDNRLLLERYLAGLLDAEQEYALRHEDVVIDMPQSGERIRGRDHMKAMQEAYPGPPMITVRRVVGSGDVWVVEGRSDYGGRIYHIANILEFREGKIIRETLWWLLRTSVRKMGELLLISAFSRSWGIRGLMTC